MKNKNPKISVVMTVYNEEKFLDESMQSILNQTFKDFEFIILNNNSEDKSLNIIKKVVPFKQVKEIIKELTKLVKVKKDEKEIK